MYRKVTLDDAGAYKKTDKGALDGLGDGTAAGSWEASVGRVNLTGGFVGSPGIPQRVLGGVVRSFGKNPATISATGVIINEVSQTILQKPISTGSSCIITTMPRMLLLRT